MNVKEALKIIEEYQREPMAYSGTDFMDDMFFAQGLIECHELYKPLVEALESISKNSCCDQCQEAKLVSLKPLEHYRTKIMGDK